jgi:hypothetical protein
MDRARPLRVGTDKGEIQMKSVLCALLIASAPTVALAVPAKPQAVAEPAEAEKDAKALEQFDPAQIMAVFDKMFPAQPDPDPTRLALSMATAKVLLPDGTYTKMMDGLMGGIVDRVMDMSEADFGGKGKDGKAPSKETLRQAAIKEDPHFEERMRIMERVVTEEMGKIAKIIEPKLREGLARSMARRFDARQLADINAFLATDSGRAFGSQSMSMWVDPDLMRAMVGTFPEILEAMPAAMKRLETETAHLPKPKKKVEAKKVELDKDDEE